MNKEILLALLILLGMLTSCESARKTVGLKTVENPYPTVSVLDYETQRCYDEFYLESIRQREAQNDDAAYELLSEALRINPQGAEAAYELGILLLKHTSVADTINRKRAENLLKEAAMLRPDNTFFQQSLAENYIRQGNYDEAIKIYENLISKRTTPEWLYELGRIYAAKGNFFASAETLERLEAITERTENTSISKYQLYLQAGDQERAFKSIEDLCAAYPNDLRYRVLLGDFYAGYGNQKMALATYQDVLSLEPNNAYAQLSMLAYYMSIGEEKEYEALLRRLLANPETPNDMKVEALRVFSVNNHKKKQDSTVVFEIFEEQLTQPDVSPAIIELYAQYLNYLNHDTEELRPLMKRLLEIEPDNAKARLQLLALDLKKNDETAILNNCRQGRIYHPAQAIYSYYEGIVLYRQGDAASALDVLEKGAQHIDESTDREIASELYAILGDLYHEQGKHNEAYCAYDSALTFNPSNLMCMNNYAYFLALDNRELEKAQTMSQKTILAEPKNTTFLDTYAWILYCSGQYTQARIYIDEMLKYETDELDATVLEHAGDIYFRNGERQEAIKFWRQALKVCKESQQKKQLQRKIQRKRL